MYKAEEIAAYVIKTTEWMSNFKLQSVLYFVQAEFLVVKGRPCFEDPIEAWNFGPVIFPNTYFDTLLTRNAEIELKDIRAIGIETLKPYHTRFYPEGQIDTLKTIAGEIQPDTYEAKSIMTRPTFYGYSKK